MSKNESLSSNNSAKSTVIIRPSNEVFKHLFHTKEWSDLTITLGSKSFSVHRNIICPAMPYFNTMMSSEFKESRQDHVTLNHLIDIEAFECLLNWAYFFKLNIDLTNVHSLLVASDYFHVTQVFRDCCEYLDSVLNIETALEIKEIIKDLEVGKLASKVTTFIIVNFTIISKTKEWFELPFAVLTRYLENGDAVGFDENEIVNAILRWAEYKPDSRQEHLSSLLKLVKWKFVDPTRVIKEIASHELVKSNESCRKLLREVFELLAFQSTASSLASHWKNPRIRKYNVEVMMAFVKLPGELVCFIQLPYSECWKHWMTLDMDLRGRCKIAATDECFYIHSNKDSVFIHLPSKAYQKTTSAYVHSVTASSDKFFITEDAKDDQSSHIIKSIQYLSSNNLETNVAMMSKYLSGYRSIYLDNALYFIGGSRKDKKESTELQKYDIAQSKWTHLTSMSTSRLNPHVVALDGKIYVIGGTKYDKILGENYSINTGEYYDPCLNKWFNILLPWDQSTLVKMPFPKIGHLFKFVIAHRSKLYAFQGKKLKIVHIYDPKTGKWKEDSKDIFCQDVLSVISIPNFNGQLLS